MNKIFYIALFFSLLFVQSNIDIDNINDYELNENMKYLINEDDGYNSESNVPIFEYLEIDNNSNDNSQDSLSILFGYDFFLNADKLLNIDNLPATADYTLGPGDEIIVSIWGEINSYENYTIDRNGNVFIDEVGQVFVSGKTLESSQNILFDKYSEIYSTMKGNDPTTFFNLSIGNLKSININFIGEVNNPGYYSIHPFSTISMGLVLNGGIKESGTLRDIQLIREGKIISNFDFYQLIVKGKTDTDVQLKNDDIIYVPYRSSSIEVLGEVSKPAIYEVKSNETVEDLFDFCGGMLITSTGKIEVLRIMPFDERTKGDSPYQGYILNADQMVDFEVKNGDVITVKKIAENMDYISIFGQVKNPGVYPFDESVTLLDLMLIAGGINDPTYSKTMSLNNIEIIRVNENKDFPDLISVNLENQNINKTVKLKNLDYISVKKNPRFKEPEVVSIEGEIVSPGYYAIVKESETLNEIIQRSGGFTSFAYLEGIQMHREENQVIIKNQFNIKVKDGDKIIVPKKDGTVVVQGEVYNPGIVQHVKNKGIQYYINSAGGYNKSADTKDVTVIYANGDIGVKTFWRNPRIEDGCTIVVHEKEETIPVNRTELISNIASIITSLSTIIYIIDQNNGN